MCRAKTPVRQVPPQGNAKGEDDRDREKYKGAKWMFTPPLQRWYDWDLIGMISGSRKMALNEAELL